MTTSRVGALVEFTRRSAIWIPIAIVGLLGFPVVATRRTFGPDWTLHLWAIRQQELNIRAMGHPGLFVSVNPLGAFYPLFAFVGSGIYSVGGFLALLIGPIAAYRWLHIVGLAMAYGGLTWLAVQFGLRGWRSQMPGAMLVTGTYFVTDMVGRGDFGEFVAVAALPLLFAAVTAMVRKPTVGTWERLAVIASVFVFTGSHNITLLIGTTFSVGVLLLVAIAWAPTWWRTWSWRRIGELALLGAVGGGLNAWFLLPDVANSFNTRISKHVSSTKPIPNHVFLRGLLSPLRPGDLFRSYLGFFGRDIRLSFPMLFFGWFVLALLGLWRRRDWDVKLWSIGLLGMITITTVMVGFLKPYDYIPHIYWSMQFTYRMEAYVLLATALLVLVLLVWDNRAKRLASPLLRGSLVLIVLFSVGMATWQVWQVKSWYYASVGARYQPAPTNYADVVVASKYTIAPSWYARDDFVDFSTPVVPTAAGRQLFVPYGSIHGSDYSGVLAVPDGRAPFATNIAAGPKFVTMDGITAVGRDSTGFIVATRAKDAPATGPLHVSISMADTPAIALGEIISLLSVLFVVGVIAWPRLSKRIAKRRRVMQPEEHDEPSLTAV